MDTINTNHGLAKEELTPGQIINDFEIIGELGRGANGIVYRARQIQLAREVALKILPAAKAADKDFVESFFREARLAAKINHPSIVMMIDVGVSDNGIYFMAMELIEGETLDDLVAKNGPVEFHQGLKMAQEIAEGLDYAWRTQRLTHGDIKPANIIITASGKAKIADLGLAKIADEKHIGDLMATPMFAAPEVCLFEFDKIGFKSDIYSYACTLFFMFAGEAPFEEEDSDKVMQMHVSKPPPELIERLPFLPQNVSDYVGQMLAKQPEERPEQWSDIVDFFRQSRAELARNASPPKKQNLKKNFIWMVIIVLLCGIVGPLMWYFLQGFKVDSAGVQVQQKADKPNPVLTIDELEPKLNLETKKQATNQALRLSVENRYREIVGDANFRAKPYSQLMEIERELGGLQNRLKTSPYLSELNLSAIEEQLKVDLKLLPVLIVNKRAEAESERLQRALLGFREKPPALPDGTLSPAMNVTSQYFRALSVIINQTPFHDGMLLRQSPENREQLQFLKKYLQQTGSPKEIILHHHQKFVGQRLPWSWQGSQEWDIASIELDKFNLTRTVTGGGMFRSRMTWEILNDHQIALLVENLITQRGENHLNSTDCSALVGWLFRIQELGILDKVTATPGRMNETERLRWRRFVDEAQNIGYEQKTGVVWNQIRRLLRGKNYPQALNKLAVFTNSGLRGVLYSMLQPEVEQLLEALLWRYPEIQGQFICRKINQMEPTEVVAVSLCGTALARYYATRSDPEKKSLQNFMQRALKVKTVNSNKISILPQNQPLSPGELHQWIVKNYPDLNQNSIIMQSALLDIGDWEQLAINFKTESNPTESSKSFYKEFSKWDYSYLYDLGFIALQYGDVDSGRRNLTLMLENLPEIPDQRNVVTARLAIAMRDYKTAETMLEALEPENQSFAAYQLMLAGLLIDIQNPDFSERDFGAAVELLKVRFKSLNLSADLKILEFAKDIYQGKTGTISKENFEQCREPALLGLLCCDILTRDVLLSRNNAEPSIVDVIPIADSCYFASLWYRIALLKMLQNGPLIQEWRKSLKALLSDYSFAALPNYPQLLMLKCFYELLEGQVPIEHAALGYGRIIDSLPMASASERNFAAALREPARFHSENAYWTILAAAVSEGLREDGNPDKILKNIRKQHPQPLWQEMLLERDLKTMLNAIKIQKRPLK